MKDTDSDHVQQVIWISTPLGYDTVARLYAEHCRTVTLPVPLVWKK